MADYHSLLAKAVAGLADPAPEARRAIYARAREALNRQLRTLDPPVPDEVVDREAHALEVAIAQLETEIVLRQPAGDELPSSVPERDLPIGAALPPEAPTPARLFKGRRDRKGKKRPRSTNSVDGLGEGEAGPSQQTSSEGAANGPVPQEMSGAPPSANALLEARRPMAPSAQWNSGNAKRLLLASGVVGLIVAVMAIAAYRLRDRPEDLMRAQTPPASMEGAGKGGAKIAERVGEGGASPSPAGSTPQAPASRSAEAEQRTPAPVPLARRAALLIEAPEEKSKVKTFVGSVLWRTENVSGGTDEPLRSAVKAEIDVPEEKLQATVAIQKNFDGTLPASHTVKVAFALGPGSSLGAIKQIDGLQMRQEDRPIGEQLKGAVVPITENAFLIGLAQGDAEAANLELMRSREWLDIPIVLGNGRAAKLTFEKGPDGQRALDEAMASWRGQ